jgi:uncharacterized protein YjbI with pentapeptide repeats
MFNLKRYIEKFKKFVDVDEVVKLLEKLPNDPALQQISQNAGLVGGIINIGLQITEKVIDAKIPIETRLSFTLMRIMLESTRDSLQFTSNVNIEKFLNEEADAEQMENAVVEFFNPRYKRETYDDITNHPVISKFRNQLKRRITEYNEKNNSNISIPLFLTEFNSNLLLKLEEEKTKNEDLKKLLHKWEVNNDFYYVLNYLRNAKKIFFEINAIDERSLSEYYLENKAYIVDIKKWDNEEIEIKKKGQWNPDSFLQSKRAIEVIAAPFGIGKSSFGKKIAYDYATRFIQDPTDPTSFIPIFVPLKFALEKTCNGNSLKTDLADITSHSSSKENTKILIILDGLDELPDDRPVNIHNIMTTIEGLSTGYPKRKFIITTRLESGFPRKLNIEDTYVRLFSFDRNQVKEFFRLYGIPENLDNLSEILSGEKYGKPLFCWMIATVYHKSSQEERKMLFGKTKYAGLREIFLYQQFIHNVILGKPRKVAQEDFEEWFRRSGDEKRALRLIAFMKNENPLLTKNKAQINLDSFKFVIPKSTGALISTYFSTSVDEQGTERLEFIHKSFGEYLLAEFYIESLVNGKYHRLMGVEPSSETYDFLHGLIEFLTTDEESIKKYSKHLISTIYEDKENIELERFIQDLQFNSIKFIKEQKLGLENVPREELLWTLWPLEIKDFKKIWNSKWIGIFMAGNIARKYPEIADKAFIESARSIISNSGSIIKNKYLRGVYLPNIDLRDANLALADFSGADLTGANFENTYLVGSYFSDAILKDAKFTGANLAAYLSNTERNFRRQQTSYSYRSTRFERANLTGADFGFANLERANLQNAILKDAHLWTANLKDADIEDADLTGAEVTEEDIDKTRTAFRYGLHGLLAKIKYSPPQHVS